MASPHPASARRGTGRSLSGVVGDLALFSLATIGTYIAQWGDRPITSVLIFVTGVILIGARSGLSRGLSAAVGASLIYNFFLSEPTLRFGFSSLDEAVPLLAFNTCALITGALAGRLTDRARAARAAEAQNALLLRISDSLQTAIALDDVEKSARQCLLPYGISDIEIYYRKDGELYRCGDGSSPIPALEAFLPKDTAPGDTVRSKIFELYGTHDDVGLVKFGFNLGAQGDERLADMQPVANMLALAIDRCLLLEKLAESHALKRSEELKSAILSSMSHDLRTPLTVIEAAAGSLRTCDRDLDPQRNELLSTIVDQCRKLNRYTANLLDIGRIQAGISPSSFADIDVIEILGVALANLRHAFPDQPLHKDFSVSHATIRASGPMLEQAFFNILENAAIHGSRNDPLTVRIERVNGDCIIEITDQGAGIAESDQALIFTPFYRSAQRPQRRGSGLGLYIARGFIEAFGGDLSVHSPVRADGGTRLAIRLPLSAETDRLESAA